MFGRQAIVILVSVYCVLWLWFKVSPDSIYIYSEVFYFVGCFIIGPVTKELMLQCVHHEKHFR